MSLSRPVPATAGTLDRQKEERCLIGSRLARFHREGVQRTNAEALEISLVARDDG